MTEPGPFEEALAGAEAQAGASLRSAAGVTRELRRAASAAREGRVRELRRSVAAAREQWQALGERLGDLEGAYVFDDAAYLAGGGFAGEVLAEAGRAGVSVSPDPDAPDRLLSYPSVVRILPGDAAVEIDKRRERRLRPSVLVARLARGQQRPARFQAAAFLEALAGGYDLTVARQGREPGQVVRLDAVWSVLTLLPGARADYAKPEFARDLYLLDQSGQARTRDGRTVRFSASTGTRGAGVLSTVARGGRQQLYWGVAFAAAGQPSESAAPAAPGLPGGGRTPSGGRDGS